MEEVESAIWLWGSNLHGQLGCSDAKVRSTRPRPCRPLASSAILQVSCGGFHTAAIADGLRPEPGPSSLSAAVFCDALVFTW